MRLTAVLQEEAVKLKITFKNKESLNVSWNQRGQMQFLKEDRPIVRSKPKKEPKKLSTADHSESVLNSFTCVSTGFASSVTTDCRQADI